MTLSIFKYHADSFVIRLLVTQHIYRVPSIWQIRFESGQMVDTPLTFLLLTGSPSHRNSTSWYYQCFVCIPWWQYSWGQHGAHLGPASLRWAQCWLLEPCYLGRYATWLSRLVSSIPREMLDIRELDVSLCLLQATINLYSNVIMSSITSQTTSLAIVYLAVYLSADQRKHKSSASLAFVWRIHR